MMPATPFIKRMGCRRPTSHTPSQADLSAFILWRAILPALTSHWTPFTTLTTATCRETGRSQGCSTQLPVLRMGVVRKAKNMKGRGEDFMPSPMPSAPKVCEWLLAHGAVGFQTGPSITWPGP